MRRPRHELCLHVANPRGGPTSPSHDSRTLFRLTRKANNVDKSVRLLELRRFGTQSLSAKRRYTEESPQMTSRSRKGSGTREPTSRRSSRAMTSASKHKQVCELINESSKREREALYRGLPSKAHPWGLLYSRMRRQAMQHWRLTKEPSFSEYHRPKVMSAHPSSKEDGLDV